MISGFGYNQGWAFLLALLLFRYLKTRVSSWERGANSGTGSKPGHGGALANLAVVRRQQTHPWRGSGKPSTRLSPPPSCCRGFVRLLFVIQRREQLALRALAVGFCLIISFLKIK